MTRETDTHGNTVWVGEPSSYRAPIVPQYPPIWMMYPVELLSLVGAIAFVLGVFTGIALERWWWWS